MYVSTAAEQTDGKIVVAGTDGNGNFMLGRYNTDGTLDVSFANNGVIITDISTAADALNALVITADGKIIAGGSTVQDGHNQFALVQYTSAGAIDITFGNNGIVVTDFSGFYSTISSLTLQADGKILAAGGAGTNDGDFALARYNGDGSLDMTFNGTGELISNFGYNDGANSVLINSDGEIYAGGLTTDASGYWRFLIASYNSDGSPNLNFNNGLGFVSPVFGNSFDILTNIKLQSNGKIIAVGTTNLDPASSDIEMIRINPDGSLDNSFGNNGNGLVLIDINSAYDESEFLVIQPDDKIVTGGYHADFADPNVPAYLFSCFRFNAEGIPDTEFGTAGSFTDFVPNSFFTYTSLFEQADGKLLAASEWFDAVTDKISISRFNASGMPDNSYGQNGMREINPSSGFSYFQPDGKLLRLCYSNGDIMLLRYDVDGNPDASFGSGGTVISDFGGNESSTIAAIQLDGKIIIGGSNRDNNGSDFLIARYNSDGSVDGSFGNGGFVKMDFENEDGVQALAFTPDGKIIFAGTSTSFPPDFSFIHFDIMVGRLNSDGSLDMTFGNNGRVIIDRSDFDYMGGLQIQKDQKITLTYFASSDGSLQHAFIERLNKDGGLDNSFGQSGTVVSEGVSMLLQNDQKILIAGNKINDRNNIDFTLSRFNTDGTPDVSFGTNGKTISSFIYPDNSPYLQVISGSNLFVAGYGTNENGAFVGLIAKFDLGNVDEKSSITCPANQTVNTDNNSCAATVNNIDPTVTPAGATVNYTLIGATTGKGSGSVSGKPFNKGVTTVTYTLTNDATKSCSFTVTVQDKQLPVINNLSVSQTTLWPPDHKLKDITVNYSTTDNCGIANTQISVSSNEPVQSRDKDDQSPDWQIVDDHHIRLRAERLESGSGRTYTVKITTTDVSGNQNTATSTVIVPKSMGNQKPNLSVTAAPNPSHSYFEVIISSNFADKINARLLNNKGNVINTIDNIIVPKSLKIGDRLMPGIYFLEVTQSGITKTIKLIKQ
jgi:uncharacterized delta-60 repeat protein